MVPVLALDVGKRRTGVALGDDERVFVMALDTIEHGTVTELVKRVGEIASGRKVESIVIGLPLLPDGSAGEQAAFTRDVGQALSKAVKVPVIELDERYTTSEGRGRGDRDAESACNLLQTYLERRKQY